MWQLLGRWSHLIGWELPSFCVTFRRNACSHDIMLLFHFPECGFYLGHKCLFPRLCGLVVRVSGYRYRGPWFDSRRYQIFWVAVGLEQVHSASWGQLRSYLNKEVAAPGLENRDLTAVGICCADHVTPLYPQKLALTSPTGSGRSVGIVRSRTKAMEFSF
jgi:hypothetical protein